MFSFLNQLKEESGVSLYMAVIVVSLLLSMVLAASSILFYQLRIIKGSGNSVIAFYATDSGIEQALYDISDCLNREDNGNSCKNNGCEKDKNGDGYCDGVENDYEKNGSIDSGNNISYEVKKIKDKKEIQAIGRYKGLFQRAIQISF